MEVYERAEIQVFAVLAVDILTESAPDSNPKSYIELPEIEIPA